MRLAYAVAAPLSSPRAGGSSWAPIYSGPGLVVVPPRGGIIRKPEQPVGFHS